MFPMKDWRSDAKRKRDDEWQDSLDQPRQEQKKLRPLPIRTSPVIRHVNPNQHQPRSVPRSVPLTLTPATSPEDGSNDLMSADQAQGPSSQASSLEVRVTDDEDMEMIDLQSNNNGSPPPWFSGPDSSPTPMLHSPMQLGLSVSGGRVATPIYGHFNPDVTMDASDDTLVHSDQTNSREDDGNWRKQRRMPSPISEDEDPDTMLSPKSKYSSAPLQDSSHDHRSNNSSLRPEPRRFVVSRQCGAGHQRSGSYDLRTGIKTTFAMGYRADCEKCVMKVPGHYAHIIKTGPSGEILQGPADSWHGGI